MKSLYLEGENFDVSPNVTQDGPHVTLTPICCRVMFYYDPVVLVSGLGVGSSASGYWCVCVWGGGGEGLPSAL